MLLLNLITAIQAGLKLLTNTILMCVLMIYILTVLLQCGVLERSHTLRFNGIDEQFNKNNT